MQLLHKWRLARVKLIGFALPRAISARASMRRVRINGSCQCAQCNCKNITNTTCGIGTVCTRVIVSHCTLHLCTRNHQRTRAMLYENDQDVEDYTHEVPEGYRLMVVPFVDSSEAVCTVHPTPCQHTWCASYWMNYAITKVTGSKYTHCELYWPHSQVSTSVDSELNVHQKKSRTYVAMIGHWEFLTLLIAEEQEWLMSQYIEAQMNKQYDKTSFYLFGLLSFTSCMQPRARPLHHSMCPEINTTQLRHHLPPTETCARLLMGAMVFAGIVTPRDVRLATPQSVYQALAQAGAESTDVLPRTRHVIDSIHIPSAYELATQRNAQSASQAQKLGYALSGGIIYEHSMHGGAHADDTPPHHAPRDDHYWRQCGVEVPDSRFVHVPSYRT